MRFLLILIILCFLLAACTTSPGTSEISLVTPGTPALADLQIIEAHLPYTPCYNWTESLSLEFVIQNTGGTDAGYFDVLVENPYGRGNVQYMPDGLAAGESHTLVFPDVELGFLSGGEFTIVIDYRAHINEADEDNNRITVSIENITALEPCPDAPAFQPDLVILAAENSLIPACLGAPMAIEFWVENRGSLAAPRFQFEYNGQFTYVDVELLPQEVVYVFTYTSNLYDPIELDPNHQIEEWDETNNAIQPMIMTFTPPAPCSPDYYFDPQRPNFIIAQTSTPRAEYTEEYPRSCLLANLNCPTPP